MPADLDRLGRRRGSAADEDQETVFGRAEGTRRADGRAGPLDELPPGQERGHVLVGDAAGTGPWAALGREGEQDQPCSRDRHRLDALRPGSPTVVVEHVQAAHVQERVDAGGHQPGEVGRVAAHPLDLGTGVPGAAAGALQRLRDHLDARHRPAARGLAHRVEAGAAADVEQPGSRAGGRAEEVVDLIGSTLPGPLPRGESEPPRERPAAGDGRTVDLVQAGAAVWALTSPEMHDLLRVGAGWSAESYRTWLRETLERTLLP